MSWSYDAYFIVPLDQLTEGRFADTMASFYHLPRTRLPEWDVEHPDAPLFSTVELPEVIIGGVGMLFTASTAYEWEPSIKMPENLGYLKVSIEKWTFEDIPEQHDVLLGILEDIFSGMGAHYMVADHEYMLEYLDDFDDLLKVVGGVYIFSDEVIARLGEDNRPLLKGGHPIAGGLCLSYSRMFTEDMSKEIMERIRCLLEVFQSRVDLSTMRGVTPSDWARPHDLYMQYPTLDDLPDILMPNARTGLFLWGYYPKRNHTKERITDFLRSAMSNEWLRIGTRPCFEALDHNVDRLLNGRTKMYLNDVKIDYLYFLTGHVNIEIICTSKVGDQVGYGSSMERDDMVSILLIIEDTMSSLKAYELVAPFYLRLVDAFTKTLEVEFAFGHSDYNLFSLKYDTMAPPEERLWPVTVLNLSNMNPDVVDSLRSFWEDHVDRWAWYEIDDGRVLLHYNSLMVPVDELDDYLTFPKKVFDNPYDEIGGG